MGDVLRSQGGGAAGAYLQSLHGLLSLLLQLTHVRFLALKSLNFLKTRKSHCRTNMGCAERTGRLSKGQNTQKVPFKQEVAQAVFHIFKGYFIIHLFVFQLQQNLDVNSFLEFSVAVGCYGDQLFPLTGVTCSTCCHLRTVVCVNADSGGF